MPSKSKAFVPHSTYLENLWYVNSNRTLYLKLAVVFAGANSTAQSEGAPCVRLGTTSKVEYKPKVVIDGVNCPGVFSVGVERDSQSSQGSQDVDNPSPITHYYVSEKYYTNFKADRNVLKWFASKKLS